MLLEPRSSELLLRIAALAIESGLSRLAGAPPAEGELPAELRAERASFVTLTVGGRLRGCCGTLEAQRALATDVWHNARASAFRDPRFLPVQRVEWQAADLEISILSPLEPIEASTEKTLLQGLQAGVDGLLLAWRGQRATFLPKVWEHLRDPDAFLRQLKMKAGWDAGFWAADMEAWRYRAEVISLERPARSIRTSA